MLNLLVKTANFSFYPFDIPFLNDSCVDRLTLPSGQKLLDICTKDPFAFSLKQGHELPFEEERLAKYKPRKSRCWG